MESGCGRYRLSKEGDQQKNFLIAKIVVRPDSMIPDFDTIVEVEFTNNQSSAAMTEEVLLLEKMLTEHGGMFVNDALKLTEKDLIISEDPRLEKSFEELENLEAIPALRAVKKAIYDYLEKTGQSERLRKAQEKIICNCRNVTDTEIKEMVAKGYKTFEEIKKVTTAGTSCGTCENRVKDLL